jgi:hydroxymethylbilane synthase
MRIGTRGSALALAQSEHVRASLPATGEEHRICIIKTTGDLNPGASLQRIGGKGLFTKEIEEALLADEVDLAVHSLKDLPTEMAPGLAIGALLKREEPRDALISRDGRKLDDLPSGSRIGTSSLRRRAQILARRPDLVVEDLRGNVPTRIRRVEEGRFDAVVVAAAGLRRLNLFDRVTELIEESVLLPAPGQGVVGVQIRAGDARTAAAVATLHDPAAAAEATAERALLAALGGGCIVPVGARAHARDGRLTLEAFVGNPSGRPTLRRGAEGAVQGAEELGRALAAELLAQGARAILDEVRSMERFP